jgi:hypothetical protein
VRQHSVDIVERQRTIQFLKADHALAIRLKPVLTQVAHDQPEIRLGVLEHQELER